MVNRVVSIDIPVNDVERAIRFYSAVLGEACSTNRYSV